MRCISEKCCRSASALFDNPHNANRMSWTSEQVDTEQQAIRSSRLYETLSAHLCAYVKI